MYSYLAESAELLLRRTKGKFTISSILDETVNYIFTSVTMITCLYLVKTVRKDDSMEQMIVWDSYQLLTTCFPHNLAS